MEGSTVALNSNNKSNFYAINFDTKGQRIHVNQGTQQRTLRNG